MKRFCSVRLGKGALCLLWLHILERTMTNLSDRHVGKPVGWSRKVTALTCISEIETFEETRQYAYLCCACTTSTARFGIQSQDTINRLTPPGNRRESRSNRVESNLSLNGQILRPAPTISIAAPHLKHPSASKISSSWSQGQPNSLPSTSCGPQKQDYTSRSGENRGC